MTLAARLRATLARPPRGDIMVRPADFDNDDDEAAATVLTPAAVLVAITDRAEPGVILTLRHAGLRAHAGQVAFPGGRIDPGDADAVTAALREAEEEIGLARGAVEVIGAGDVYRTGSGYVITPVVGVVPPDLPLVANPDEVDAIFEVPLAYLLDRANHVPRTGVWRGRERHYIDIQWQDRRVWGATAAMLANLAARLADD